MCPLFSRPTEIEWPETEEIDAESGQSVITEAIRPDARNLITGLLSRLPANRLALASVIEHHPFFAQVGPWSELEHVQMPFVPCPDDETDTCYFEACS